jgi:hypothetical protein
VRFFPFLCRKKKDRKEDAPCNLELVGPLCCGLVAPLDHWDRRCMMPGQELRCGVSSTKWTGGVVRCRPAVRPRSPDREKKGSRTSNVQVHCTMCESRITSHGRHTGAIKKEEEKGTKATNVKRNAAWTLISGRGPNIVLLFLSFLRK